jgi:hypothetical protein
LILLQLGFENTNDCGTRVKFLVFHESIEWVNISQEEYMVLIENEKVYRYKLRRKNLTECNRDVGRKSSTPSSSFVPTSSFSPCVSFPSIVLFGLVKKRDRANLLVSDLFAGDEPALLSEKHLLGVFIAGGEAISFVGVETSLVGVAVKELIHCLTGVTS